MRFHKNMVSDDGIENIDKIKRSLSKKTGLLGIYCICMDYNSKSLMEILHSIEIFKVPHKNKDYIVIGLASSENQAVTLISTLIQNHIEEEKDIEIFKNNWLADTKSSTNNAF